VNYLHLRFDTQKRYKYAKNLSARLASQTADQTIQVKLPVEIKCLDKANGVYQFKGEDINLTEYGIISIRVG